MAWNTLISVGIAFVVKVEWQSLRHWRYYEKNTVIIFSYFHYQIYFRTILQITICAIARPCYIKGNRLNHKLKFVWPLHYVLQQTLSFFLLSDCRLMTPLRCRLYIYIYIYTVLHLHYVYTLRRLSFYYLTAD